MSGLKDKMTAAEFRDYLRTNEATRQRKARQEKPDKKKTLDDSKLWAIFSQYIRLKYSNENGVCFCYTCGRPAFWRQIDCGHGIPAHHLATKYEETNNRPQCGRCNGPEGGRREAFKEKMDKDHGPGTWEKLEIKSRGFSRLTEFEIDVMAKFYGQEVEKLKKDRGL